MTLYPAYYMCVRLCVCHCCYCLLVMWGLPLAPPSVGPLCSFVSTPVFCVHMTLISSVQLSFAVISTKAFESNWNSDSQPATSAWVSKNFSLTKINKPFCFDWIVFTVPWPLSTESFCSYKITNTVNIMSILISGADGPTMYN